MLSRNGKRKGNFISKRKEVFVFLLIIISYHIISYHIISYHIISYHIISHHITSHHITSHHITSHHHHHHLFHVTETRLYQLSAPKRIIQVSHPPEPWEKNGRVSYHVNCCGMPDFWIINSIWRNLLPARHDELSISTGRGVGLESIKWSFQASWPLTQGTNWGKLQVPQKLLAKHHHNWYIGRSTS